jgi:hypothetical protein
MRCWRRIEKSTGQIVKKIKSKGYITNIKEEINTLHTCCIKGRKANWNG